MSGTLSVIVTEIIFIRFRQIGRLIGYKNSGSILGVYNQTSPKLTSTFNYFNLNRFFTYHTQNMSIVFSFNQLYSKLLLAYIVSSVPLSALIISYLIREQVLSIQTLFLGTILLGQFATLFGNHLMAAMYPLKIHEARVPLTRLSLRLGQTGTESAQFDYFETKLKLANYIAKLSTDNQYGISYLQNSLVTMASFFKVCFSYI